MKGMAQAIGPVREALNALGIDAPTDKVLAYVKEKHKIDETNQKVNQTRANMRQALKAKGESGSAPVPTPRVEEKKESRASFLAASIKELIDEFGAKEVQDMIAVFVK
jgi:hypothetical protein